MNPRLLEGTSYRVMIRNLWRLLATGKTMAEARALVLSHAGVRDFPSPPPASSGSPTLDRPETSVPTIH